LTAPRRRRGRARFSSSRGAAVAGRHRRPPAAGSLMLCPTSARERWRTLMRAGGGRKHRQASGAYELPGDLEQRLGAAPSLSTGAARTLSSLAGSSRRIFLRPRLWTAHEEPAPASQQAIVTSPVTTTPTRNPATARPIDSAALLRGSDPSDVPPVGVDLARQLLGGDSLSLLVGAARRQPDSAARRLRSQPVLGRLRRARRTLLQPPAELLRGPRPRRDSNRKGGLDGRADREPGKEAGREPRFVRLDL
jgi:hypothetical protein